MTCHRMVAGAVFLAVTAVAAAQSPGNMGRSYMTDPARWSRLQLQVEWLLALPTVGNRDALLQVQTVDDQIFVQTRSGLLIAIDARNGRIQWQKQLGTGGYSVMYPVAVNDNFVFATHVTRLYAFDRRTGVAEFEFDLESSPSGGLAADNQAVYCVLGMRSGNNAVHRVVAYNLIPPLPIAGKQRTGPVDPERPWLTDTSPQPVDELLRRYQPGRTYDSTGELEVFRPKPPPAPEAAGGYTGSRTPSLSTLPRITPPYTLTNENYTPSLNVLPSVNPPYRLRSEAGKYIQPSPSIGTIPPSVAAALALTDLRPKPVRPTVRWEFGTPGRMEHPPYLATRRVWVFMYPQSAYALNKIDKTIEIAHTFPDAVSAPPAQGGTTLYVPTLNMLWAIDGDRGGRKSGVETLWQAPVGGRNNHQPLVTDKYIFVSGDETGIVCLNRQTGERIWQTASPAIDQVIAVNEEFAYARDREGRFHVFDVARPTDPQRRTSLPLATVEARDFDATIVNTVTDRVYLATHSGLIICLRHAAAKYATPRRITPVDKPAKEPAKEPN